MISYLMRSLLVITFFWWLMALVLLASFVVTKTLVFYILFELRLLPILLILLFLGNQPERLSAGAYFLCYTLVFSLPFMIFVLTSRCSGSFLPSKELELSTIMTLLILGPFLVKIPVFGLHF